MPRSSGRLRSSALLDTGSSGTWEVQCLTKAVSPEGECSQPWMHRFRLWLMVRRP